MSTSDQDGQRQLTRKQLREIRLTGSTPVITEDQAAAAIQPAPVLARAAEPVEIAPAADIEVQESDAPLTRRQMRALEHVRAAADEHAAEDDLVSDEADVVDEPVFDEADVVDEPVSDDKDVADEASVDEPVVDEPLVSGIPSFGPTFGAANLPRFDADRESEPAVITSDREQVAAIFDEPSEGRHPLDETVTPAPAPEPALEAPEKDASVADADELEVITAERPMVGAAFGLGVKPEKPEGALFDDLLDGGSSSGTQHSTSTALIFTPSAGAGSLSGPIASTGELLITGTYALADGIGSQGHAHGTADGRDADAVLLDGELAPSSSPTPIAASSAISTSKSAGEVIRPPMPDKSNKLMLTLAIVAGGLALALAATLIIAATTGVFG